MNEIKIGLTKVGKMGIKVDSIGVDTWGVDIVPIGKDGHIIGNPRAYRDPYTVGIPEEFFEKMPCEELYGRTGIQIMNFNTIFQLYALKKENNSTLEAADKLLFIPDAISYLLTGNMVCEYTILSTAGFLDPYNKCIDEKVLSVAGVSPDLFPEVVMPGHIIGTLTPEYSEQTGLGEVKVVAVAGHDTGSAVAAVPAPNKNFAYISSGTWSLIGIESEDPIINEQSYAQNITNEGGIDGTTRFLKNVTGMWLLEECRKEWSRSGKDYSYPEIVGMMSKVEPFQSLVDPDHPSFAAPKSMITALKEYCAAHNEVVPESDEAIVRCIFDSLSLKYRAVIDMLKGFSKEPIETLYVVGGGSKNALLNQCTANSTGLKVVAGPSEATAIGNVMVQARAAGLVENRFEMRELIAQSVELAEFMPQDSEIWSAAYEKFLKIIK
jgi:rhamnulokinase